MSFIIGISGVFLLWTTVVQSILLLSFITVLFVGIFVFEYFLIKQNHKSVKLKNLATMQNKHSDSGKSITSGVDNIIIGLIVFLLCALPLAIDLHLERPFSLCKLVLFYGMALFIIAVWLMKLVPVCFKQVSASLSAKNSPSSRNIPGQSILYFHHTPLTYPVLAYITAVIFSALFSLNKTISIFGYYVHYEGLLTSTGYIILFFAIITYFKKHHIFYITIAISIVGFLSSLYGIVQFLNFDPIPWAKVDERLKIISTFGNPVFFSGYIVSVFPLILVEFLSQLKNLLAQNTQHPIHLPQEKGVCSPTPESDVTTSPAAGSHRATSSPSMGEAEGGHKFSPSSTNQRFTTIFTKEPLVGKCFLAFLFAVMVLMLFNLYITKTRGAWVGFVFSILCVTVLLYFKFIIKHKIKSIIFASSFIILFSVFAGYKYKLSIHQLLYLLKHKRKISLAFT